MGSFHAGARAAQRRVRKQQRMVFGALAMVLFCMLAAVAIERFDAVYGSAVSFVAWFAVAGVSYVLVLR